MGEEIFIPTAYVPPSWVLLAVLFGIIGTLAFGSVGAILGSLTYRSKALLRVMFAVVVVAYGISWFVVIGVVRPAIVNKQATVQGATQAAALGVQQAYSSTPLYLKEKVTDPGSWGEIKGEFKGGFLSVSGSIYGKIESGRILTVVYEHPKEITFINGQYGGMHLAFSAPLSEIVIETVPKGTKPFLMFPEAVIVVGYYNEHSVVPGRVHLYLPEGWTIL